MRRLAVLLCCLAPAFASAAINPAEYTRDASLQLRLRPTVQIVDDFTRDGDAHRRTTIVATVVAEHVDVAEAHAGQVVTIDWTVNLDAQRRAYEEHAKRMGTMPGPQFLHAPAPPVPDADGLLWAHLQIDPASRRAVVPDATAPIASPDAGRAGDILIPASYQYSFDPPADTSGSDAQPKTQTVAELLASGARSGLVRVHGCLHASDLAGLDLYASCGEPEDPARSVDVANYNQPLPLGMQDDTWRCVIVVGDWQRYGDDLITTGWASKNGGIDHPALAAADGCADAAARPPRP